MMTQEKAKKILKDAIQEDGSLFLLGHYISWHPGVGGDSICLDDYFTIEELEAIVFWMKSHKE